MDGQRGPILGHREGTFRRKVSGAWKPRRPAGTLVPDDCLVSWKLGEAQSAPWRTASSSVAEVVDDAFTWTRFASLFSPTSTIITTTAAFVRFGPPGFPSARSSAERRLCRTVNGTLSADYNRCEENFQTMCELCSESSLSGYTNRQCDGYTKVLLSKIITTSCYRSFVITSKNIVNLA